MASIGQTRPTNLSGLTLKTQDEVIKGNANKLQQQFGTIDNSGAVTPPVATPKVEVPTSLSTSQLSKTTTTPQVVDNSGVIKNIQNTLTKYTAEAGANEDFIKGAIKASGQSETPELLAQYKGKKLGDVISGLGLGEKVGYTATPAPTIAPEANKGTSSKINPATGEIIDPTSEDIANYNAKYETVSPANRRLTQLEEQANAMQGNIDQAYKDAGVKSYAENVNQLISELSKLDTSETVRGVMASLDAQDLKDQFASFEKGLNEAGAETSRNKGIILGDKQDEINQKLQGLSSQQVRDLATYTLNRTNLTQQLQVAQGNYQIASDIAKQSAESMKWAYEQKLNLYKELNLIDKEQKDELTTKNDDDFAKMEKGYVQITPEQQAKYEQDILSGKAEGSVYTDVYGNKWFKPKGVVSEETKAELLSPTEAKALGVPYGTTKGQAMALGITPTDVETIGGLTKEQLSELNKIRTDMRQDPDIKEFSTVRDAYTTGSDAVNRKNSAGDIILMRMIAKITDPTTGVREEEFRTFEGAQGTLAKFGITLTKKMWGAGTLTEEGRKQLFGVMQDIYNRKKTAYDNANSFFANQGSTLGIPKNLLILDKGLKAKNYDDYYKSLSPDQMDSLDELQRKYPNLSDEDFYQLILDQGVDFNDVGGDTNQASIQLGSRLAKVNNNPGNLRYAGQNGASQGEGGFARFETPQAGYDALKNQIKLDASRGLTLEKFINKYAPPSENDTNLYVQQMVRETGASKNTPISNINLETLAKAMAKKESSTIIS